MNVKIKLISDGDVSGALMVTNDKYDVDIFLGIGGGPEGVLAASAIDAYNCKFQGRFIFNNEEFKWRNWIPFSNNKIVKNKQSDLTKNNFLDKRIFRKL